MKQSLPMPKFEPRPPCASKISRQIRYPLSYYGGIVIACTYHINTKHFHHQNRQLAQKAFPYLCIHTHIAHIPFEINIITKIIEINNVHTIIISNHLHYCIPWWVRERDRVQSPSAFRVGA